jgi:hypothetical protein
MLSTYSRNMLPTASGSILHAEAACTFKTKLTSIINHYESLKSVIPVFQE